MKLIAYFSILKIFNFQHSLVSEIRDLIYPEDRLRFDELMFRNGITVDLKNSLEATLYGRSRVCFSPSIPPFSCY